MPTTTRILFYTGGLLEAPAEPGAPERLGVEWLIPFFRSRAHVHADQLLQNLIRHATRANGEPLADDVALVLLSIRDTDEGRVDQAEADVAAGSSFRSALVAGQVARSPAAPPDRGSPDPAPALAARDRAPARARPDRVAVSEEQGRGPARTQRV
jgi:Stage II sporulation protein E (SpoIIE)